MLLVIKIQTVKLLIATPRLFRKCKIYLLGVTVDKGHLCSKLCLLQLLCPSLRRQEKMENHQLTQSTAWSEPHTHAHSLLPVQYVFGPLAWVVAAVHGCQTYCTVNRLCACVCFKHSVVCKVQCGLVVLFILLISETVEVFQVFWFLAGFLAHLINALAYIATQTAPFFSVICC